MSQTPHSLGALVLLSLIAMPTPGRAQGSIRGRVVALSGQAWAGATVRLIEGDRLATTLGDKVATTDKRGRFRISVEDDRPYYVWVHAQDKGRLLRRCGVVGPRRAGATLVLRESARRQVLHDIEWAEFGTKEEVEVELTSTLRGDRPGAQVVLVATLGSKRRTPLPPWPTDSVTATLRGCKSRFPHRVQQLNLTEGHLQNLIEAAGAKADAGSLQREHAKARERMGRPQFMSAAGPTFVRVVDAGEPAAGIVARVSITAMHKLPQKTDARGRLRCFYRRGRVTVVAELAAKRARELAGDVKGPVATSAWLGQVALRRAAPATLAIDRLVPLQLRVAHADGAPANHASVVLVGPSGLLVATTDRIGRVTILVAPGSKFRMAASWPRGFVELEHSVPEDPPARFVALPLRSVEMAHLTGSVELRNVGRSATVTLAPMQRRKQTPNTHLESRSAEVGRDGRFELWVPRTDPPNYRFRGTVFDEFGRKVAEHLQLSCDGTDLEFDASQFRRSRR